jgi:glycerate kinase
MRRRGAPGTSDVLCPGQAVKIVIAPDSFKGCLSATEVAKTIAECIRNLHPQWQTLEIPMADGGEGTVDAILAGAPGYRVSTVVKSPLLTEVDAEFAVLHGGRTAVLEMAQASGLTLVPQSELNPLATTTFGTGQLVLRAIEEGCKEILIGLGGSATVDGGAGMATALGVKFLDSKGETIPFGGGGLSELQEIDLSGRLDLSGIHITALSDVRNPLLGEDGAARVFAPQKGATPETVEILERNLGRLVEVTKRDIGIDVAEAAGCGAAGGLGFGIVAFLSGRITPGIAAVMDLVRFRERAEAADLVITGEGKLDPQTRKGKTPMGVAEAASEMGLPTVAICGSIAGDSNLEAKEPFLAALDLAELAGSPEEAMLRPRAMLREAVALFLEENPPPWGRVSTPGSQAGSETS